MFQSLKGIIGYCNTLYTEHYPIPIYVSIPERDYRLLQQNNPPPDGDGLCFNP